MVPVRNLLLLLFFSRISGESRRSLWNCLRVWLLTVLLSHTGTEEGQGVD